MGHKSDYTATENGGNQESQKEYPSFKKNM